MKNELVAWGLQGSMGMFWSLGVFLKVSHWKVGSFIGKLFFIFDLDYDPAYAKWKLDLRFCSSGK